MSVVPVVLVTACGRVVRETAKVALLPDLMSSVWVDYEIAESGEVRRRVGGWGGQMYDDLLELDHDCVSCTVREDLVPTIERLAGDGRWDSVVVFPPAAASPIGPAHQLHHAWVGKQLTSARLASVVSFVDLDGLVEDLFGDDLLDDRGLALGDGDRRSVGEVLAEQLEFSDVVVGVAEALSAGVSTTSESTGGVGLAGTATSSAPDKTTGSMGELVLHRMIAPSTRVQLDWTKLDPTRLLIEEHNHRVACDRVDPLRVWPVHQDEHSSVWTLALTSSQPLHPSDLQEQLERLGTGRIRARGYFWLSSRPDEACVWDASGGQLSIGTIGGWSGVRPGTRLVVTGVDPHDRERIERAFAELVSGSASRDGTPPRPDGFEPWLG